jgi:hypothetical protein
MNEIEKKDKILEFFNLAENRIGFFQSYDLIKLVFTGGSVSYEEIRYLVDRILSDGYLTGTNSRCQYNFTMTPFLESGGYVGEEARKKSDAEVNRKRDEKSDQKTEYELKLVKWQVWVFWFTLGFTVIGSILGIIAFFRK